MTLLITLPTNHLHALNYVAVASAVASTVAVGSPTSPLGYIHIGICCGGLFGGIFPKGEKCCQYFSSVLCVYSINEAIYNSQKSLSACSAAAAAAFSIAAFSASAFAFAASAAFIVGCRLLFSLAAST